MTEASGLKAVTDRVEREAIMADPGVPRRLPGTLININSRDNIWLREPDGVAVVGKQRRWDYYLLAPTIEEVTAQNRRLLAHIFVSESGVGRSSARFRSECGRSRHATGAGKSGL